MKRVVLVIAALSAFAPLSVAHANPPFQCAGSPEIPAAWVCLVRFQAGVDGPTLTTKTLNVDSQSVVIGPYTEGVPSQSVHVPGQPVHVPQVCAVVCVGPFDATTPPVDGSTPPVDVTVEQQTVSTPPESATVPWADVSIPPGALVVVWYQGTCYYLWPDGHASQVASASNSGCP